jgi:hypothetical protein
MIAFLTCGSWHPQGAGGLQVCSSKFALYYTGWNRLFNVIEGDPISCAHDICCLLHVVLLWVYLPTSIWLVVSEHGGGCLGLAFGRRVSPNLGPFADYSLHSEAA